MTANLSRVGDLDRHPPAGRRALVVSAQPADPGASPSNGKEAPIDDHAAEPRSDSGAACREPLTARGQARAGLTPPSPGNNRYPDYGYRRSRDGKTIHRVGCRFITRNTVHWHYPENFDLRDPAALRLDCEARAPWLHFCKACFP